MGKKIKLLRITTVPISLNILLKGQLAYMKSRGFDVHTVSANGSEIKELTEREGVRHYVVPLTRKITPVKDLLCLLNLIVFIRREKFHIVHTHTPKAGLLGMLAAKICGVPHRFHTVAGMPLMESAGLKKTILKWTESITYWGATRVYPNSLKLKEFIVDEIKIDKKKLHVIGKGSSNGIDISYFSSSDQIVSASKQLLKKYNINDDDLIITFIGRIVGDKGINELVEAFTEVKTNIDKPLKLMLVGPFEDDLNPVSPETRATINDHPDILNVGFQYDIRPFLQISNLFVFPSYREGFPNVILQAAAMGVPCIASDINGCNEIIRHDETGLLVPVKNAKELTEAMKRLIMDDTKRNIFSQRAREFVARNFDQQYVWEQIAQEYKNQINV